MYICICNAVTDTEIKACANAGAQTLAELRSHLGVAENCGRCAKAARTLLREHRASGRECGGYVELVAVS